MISTVGVLTTNRDLIVQVWDSTLAHMTRIDAAEACGRPLSAVIPDLETRGLIRYFHRVLQDGVIEVLAPAFHHYLIACPPEIPSPRFENMRQHVTIAPLEQDGRIAGLIVTVEDVTRRLDRERDMMKSLEQPSLLDNDVLRALDEGDWRIRRKAVEQWAQRTAPDAISALLLSLRDNHRNLGLLNSALKVLSHSSVDTHFTLLEFLKGRDEDLRIQAALALGEQKDNRAVPALIEALNDNNENVVYHAIEALGKLRGREAADILAGIAGSGNFFLAFPALEALSQLGDSRIAAGLVPLLDDEMLREPAANTLASIGDEFALDALIGVLNSASAPVEIIARAIVLMYDRYEAIDHEGRYIADLCGRSIKPVGVQNLIEALTTAEKENLRPLVLLLGWLDTPAAARVVTRHLGSPELRSEILEALVRHGSAVAELLIEQLDSEDLEVRWAAVTALGRIRDKRATLPLTVSLRKDSELTIPIIGALTSIGDSAAADALFDLLGTPDAAVRKAAVSALNALAPSDMVNRVIPLLEDPNPGAREAAVRISGYFGYRECVDALFSRCRDEDESVRRAAIEHLPFIDDPRTPAVLRRALSEEVATVRSAAAAAMSHVDSSHAIPALIAAIDDEDPWVRYFAARSLERHRALEAASSLYRVAQSDRFQQVRIAAFEALLRIDEKLATAVAESFTTSDNPDLQQAVASVLAHRNGTS
jgi:HEAT repeat protein